MIKNVILQNLVNTVTKLFGRLDWYETQIVTKVKRGVKYAVLTFKAAGSVFEVSALYNKVGKKFYNSISIEGKFFNIF